MSISQAIVSTREDEVLVAYSLGSCVGLTLYDPVAGVGGLLHAMMPSSAAAPHKAVETPAMFVDTGCAELLGSVLELGASRRTLVACVAGAARIFDDDGFFDIGRRNHTILRKMLWKNDILIAGEDVGGSVPRTLSLDMASGRTAVKQNGSIRDLYLPRQAKGGGSDAL